MNRKVMHPWTMVLLSVGVLLCAVVYRPYLEHQWRLWRSGMTHDAYRLTLRFPEPIILEAGITVDGVYADRQRTIWLAPDAVVYPGFRVPSIDRGDVTEMHFTLDGEPIDADQSLRGLQPRAQAYVLGAEGRSARHKARFSNGVSFYVLESLPKDRLSHPDQRMLVVDDDDTMGRLLRQHRARDQ